MAPRDDTLLWPIDGTLLLGFAPAGLAVVATLLAALLLHVAGPDARGWIVAAALAGQALVWLLFAPIYLYGWVHRHPRRNVEETGATGSAALTAVMVLLNILVYALLTIPFARDVAVPAALC